MTWLHARAGIEQCTRESALFLGRHADAMAEATHTRDHMQSHAIEAADDVRIATRQHELKARHVVVVGPALAGRNWFGLPY